MEEEFPRKGGEAPWRSGSCSPLYGRDIRWHPGRGWFSHWWQEATLWMLAVAGQHGLRVCAYGGSWGASADRTPRTKRLSPAQATAAGALRSHVIWDSELRQHHQTHQEDPLGSRAPFLLHCSPAPSTVKERCLKEFCALLQNPC